MGDSKDILGNPSRFGMAGLFVALAVLGALFHFASGSVGSELGAHPDEAAHFVTGLMVRDYLVSGFHESPLHYADEYYRHYPKIGLGVWPPFFYVFQAIWTLGSPGDVEAVLRLIYLLGLGLALLTGWWLWKEYGWLEAVTGPVLLMALPLVQMYSNMVMAEMLSALLMFGAAGYFACYMEREKWTDAIGFGALAGMAIMTKGTGLALAFVPPLAMLFARRLDLLKQKPLWTAALIVLVIAAPWTWHFRNQGRGGWEEPSPSVHFTKMAIGFYGTEICVAVGGLLALLALLGAVSLFLPRTPKPPIAYCSLALVLGVWIFQCLTPVGLEARHLMPAMPALIILAMTGLRLKTDRWPMGARLGIAGAVLVVFFLSPLAGSAGTPPGYGLIGNNVALSPFRIPKKEWHGFTAVAQQVLANHLRHTLVASDARGEGMYIADMATLVPDRLSCTVDRASKTLASSTWSGGTYHAFYTDPAQVEAALVKSGVEAVIVDSSPSKTAPHEELLKRALADPACKYRLAGALPVERDGKESPAGLELWLYSAGARENP